MLAKLNLHEILRSLGQVRPVFHSEADFQHALAWRVQQLFPTAAIRLEYRAPLPGDPLHLDLYARDEGTRIAMELKYKTRALKTTVSDETFELRTHGANPLGRYDFIKDIERVERLVDGGVADLGFAALLTNDNQYWKPVVRPDAGDTAFRLPDGAALPLQFTWG